MFSGKLFLHSIILKIKMWSLFLVQIGFHYDVFCIRIMSCQLLEIISLYRYF